MKFSKRINQPLFWTRAVVFYTGFIFHNSLTPAVESSRQSGSVLTMVLSAADRLGIENGWITEHFIRKMAHYGEYTLLGILLAAAVRQYALAAAVERLAECCLGFLIPFTDETIQLFVEGRSGQISDVWLDMAGVLTGIVVINGIRWFVKQRMGRDRG